MQNYDEYYDDISPYMSATWWVSELIGQLVYWQGNITITLTPLLKNQENLHERVDAIENIVIWFVNELELLVVDTPNVLCCFLEWCTANMAQIHLLLVKIVVIHIVMQNVYKSSPS